MKQTISLILFIVQCVFLTAQYEVKFPAVEGWQSPVEISNYDVSTLYEHINGAADLYVKYDFIEMKMGTYTRGDDYVSVEIYKHKDMNVAFGIYTAERRPDVQVVKIGTEGYLEKDALLFLYGEYYIKLYTNNSNIPADLIKIGQAITEAFFACISKPIELEAFPQEGVIPGSLRFINKNVLGLSFLHKAFMADYMVDGQKFSFFIIHCYAADECKNMLIRYLEFAGQSIQNPIEGKYVINDKYNGNVVIQWSGKCLFGMYGTIQDAAVVKYMEECKKRLKANYLL